jgi:hypothetical protein
MRLPTKPIVLPMKQRYALSSDGTRNARGCGRQPFDAPSSPERRGWTFTVRAAGTSRAINIRTLDRHPLASVGSLVLGLRCSWCNAGSAPMPVLTGLHALRPAARWSKSMPVEFLHGRPLSAEELDMIRHQIEEGFDNIAEVDPEIRGIVARNWPHLLSKLPPEEE